MVSGSGKRVCMLCVTAYAFYCMMRVSFPADSFSEMPTVTRNGRKAPRGIARTTHPPPQSPMHVTQLCRPESRSQLIAVWEPAVWSALWPYCVGQLSNN